MQGNNLSNRIAPVVAFRLENLILEYKEGSAKDAVLNLILGKTDRAIVSPKVKEHINRLYRNTDFNIVILADHVNMDVINKLRDNSVYYNNIRECKDTQALINLRDGTYTYYITKDKQDIFSVDGHLTFEEWCEQF